jgi:hypothetical protein
MEGDPLESHNRALTDEEENWNLNMMVQARPAIDRRGLSTSVESSEMDV